jgi:hypothetical protein
MPERTIVARVISPGDINSAVIRLEGELRNMRGTPQNRSATLTINVVDDLDVVFMCNALSGTGWELTLTNSGSAKPFITRSGETDFKNSSFLMEAVPAT